jgi:hypothetical protein
MSAFQKGRTVVEENPIEVVPLVLFFQMRQSEFKYSPGDNLRISRILLWKTNSETPEQKSGIYQNSRRHLEIKKPSISAPTGSNVDGVLSGLNVRILSHVPGKSRPQH